MYTLKSEASTGPFKIQAALARYCSSWERVKGVSGHGLKNKSLLNYGVCIIRTGLGVKVVNEEEFSLSKSIKSAEFHQSLKGLNGLNIRVCLSYTRLMSYICVAQYLILMYQ